ncbi:MULTISPECIES: hypothetical protein [unclassified Acidovorax]|nr:MULTISPECIES: hypothetical protein [unclassified Acidovorax]
MTSVFDHRPGRMVAGFEQFAIKTAILKNVYESKIFAAVQRKLDF